MIPFYAVYPELAERETRVLHLCNHRDLPDDSYAFVELYCLDPACDCRRVMLNIFRGRPPKQVATINHSFEPPTDEGLDQTFLDPLNVQSALSAKLLQVFQSVVLADAEYQQRLMRHYDMVKDAVRDKAHPVQPLVRAEERSFLSQPFNRAEPKVGRNQACPCGSGMKYKRCCMGRQPDALAPAPPSAG